MTAGRGGCFLPAVLSLVLLVGGAWLFVTAADDTDTQARVVTEPACEEYRSARGRIRERCSAVVETRSGERGRIGVGRFTRVGTVLDVRVDAGSGDISAGDRREAHLLAAIAIVGGSLFALVALARR